MDTGCLEVVVKRKRSTLMSFLKILTIMLAVCFVLLGLMMWPALIIGAACAVAAYFVSQNVEVEYEYTYLDRELRLAKIMNLSKRKEIGKYDLEKMEMFAPASSYHLDEFRNKKVRELDYSSREEKKPDPRYFMYVGGDTKLILEPSIEMVEAIRAFAPRKTFLN
ncbi:MAG: DUF6106 family protein [Eubacteriales bacterium]|nr:DUF6106 family protein [Eubacteriales bacterium]